MDLEVDRKYGKDELTLIRVAAHGWYAPRPGSLAQTYQAGEDMRCSVSASVHAIMTCHRAGVSFENCAGCKHVES